MTSDEKTIVPSLIKYVNSDLFTLENISSSVTLTVPDGTNIDGSLEKWDVIINYLPLKFYKLIESYSDIYTIEKFDKKYIRNPKMCAYDRYGLTNMWRPLMILNRCPSITKFDFDYIRYYNITSFTNILSVLISRVQNE
jgi:hypothetical protein